MPKGRVLIADDDEGFRATTAAVLERAGYQCDCAAETDRALELLGQRSYDALISDMRMPGGPRFRLLRSIPELNKGVPAILVTGYPSMESAIECVQLPVVAYHVKPVEPETLVQEVYRHAGCRRSTRALRRFCEEMLGHQDVEPLRERAGGAEETLVSREEHVQRTCANILSALNDLAHLARTGDGEPGEHVCRLMNCPTLRRLKQVIQDTIEVLEETKSSFRSKELRALREQLEELVQTEELC